MMSYRLSTMLEEDIITFLDINEGHSPESIRSWLYNNLVLDGEHTVLAGVVVDQSGATPHGFNAVRQGDQIYIIDLTQSNEVITLEEFLESGQARYLHTESGTIHPAFRLDMDSFVSSSRVLRRGVRHIFTDAQVRNQEVLVNGQRLDLRSYPRERIRQGFTRSELIKEAQKEKAINPTPLSRCSS